jgi:hypothetical protein
LGRFEALDVLYFGRFGAGTFWSWDVLELGRFGAGTLCLWTFCFWTLCLWTFCMCTVSKLFGSVTVAGSLFMGVQIEENPPVFQISAANSFSLTSWLYAHCRLYLIGATKLVYSREKVSTIRTTCMYVNPLLGL